MKRWILLTLPPPAFESEPEDVIEVENLIEHEDETVPASVQEVGESSTTPFLREDSDGLLPGLMRKDINSLFGRMASLSRRLCGREMAHALVEKKGKSIRTSFICYDEDRLSFAPLTQDAIRRMIKESVDDAISTEAMLGGLDNEDCWKLDEGKKVKFVAATLQGPALTWWNAKVAIMGLETRFNELDLMYPRMVEPERVKVDAYIQGLTYNIRGEVTSSKPANLNEAVRMDHKLMEPKSQARDERSLEGKKRKWESFQSRNSSGNARAMVTAATDGKVFSRLLPLCERCFTRHVGLCTIKCHKCGKIGHKVRYCKEKNVATGANRLPIPTCYDCGEKGHTRNRCPRKVKQEEVGEFRGRAYDISRFHTRLSNKPSDI
ncbi:putative reverse transcriptase domain-containing protein [Tanacetum coccineum]